MVEQSDFQALALKKDVGQNREFYLELTITSNIVDIFFRNGIAELMVGETGYNNLMRLYFLLDGAFYGCYIICKSIPSDEDFDR